MDIVALLLEFQLLLSKNTFHRPIWYFSNSFPFFKILLKFFWESIVFSTSNTGGYRNTIR